MPQIEISSSKGLVQKTGEGLILTPATISAPAEAAAGSTNTLTQAAMTFVSLLACICEGKVEGTLDEYSGEIKWSLTKEYSEIMNQKIEEIARSNPNVVEGPWQ